ncbi:hypothetical protein RLOatenuis_8710 [Rickettsiales bacterium]|nr:hypothetical protein RLOatenuis_8710 [Rickettsiales bacterium]
MLPILIALHVFVALLLILLVLLQKPKGDAAFSAASNTSLPRARFSFIAKFTMVVGLVFLLNSILLSLVGSHILGKGAFSDGALSQNSNAVIENDSNAGSVDAPFEK